MVEGVEEKGAAAAQAGIRAGDVLLQVNNQDIQLAEQFNTVVSKLDLNKTSGGCS